MNPERPPPNNPVLDLLCYDNAASSQAITPRVRQPRDLQGLLRFALEATKAEDAPGNSELGPMDEDRRRYLEEALASITVNVTSILRDAIKILGDQEKIHSIKKGDPLPQDVENAFTSLLDYVDEIDIANDFYKIGGFTIFPVCFGSENDLVRANASWVLAEVCQNNPFCQARAHECGLLDVLLNLLDTEQGIALSKCLHAISCMSRDEGGAGAAGVVAAGGCAALARQLAPAPAALPAAPAPDAHVPRTKAAFLVRHLILVNTKAKEEFIELNIVRSITEQIKLCRDASSELLLEVLSVLVHDKDPRVLDQCRDPAIGLKKILEGNYYDEEEEQVCKSLLQDIFEGYTEVEVEDDSVVR